jgi:ABC-2 type transport system ATP-binding protein
VAVETARPPDEVRTLPGVHDVALEGNQARFSVDHDRLNSVLAQLVRLDVHSLTSSPPTLEELFLRHYGDRVEHPDRELERAHRR